MNAHHFHTPAENIRIVVIRLCPVGVEMSVEVDFGNSTVSKFYKKLVCSQFLIFFSRHKIQKDYLGEDTLHTTRVDDAVAI
jgi:hypothetical protein